MEDQNQQEKKVVNEVFTKEDIEKNKVMAILAYIIWLIPYFGAKDSKFATYHAKQGLVLFLASLALYVGYWLLWRILPWSMWGFISLVSTVFSLAVLALAIIGIINASQGEAKELPIIGQYSKKF
jgi:uncharacterized membrane protein